MLSKTGFSELTFDGIFNVKPVQLFNHFNLEFMDGILIYNYMVASKWTKQGWRPKCPTHPNPGLWRLLGKSHRNNLL